MLFTDADVVSVALCRLPEAQSPCYAIIASHILEISDSPPTDPDADYVDLAARLAMQPLSVHSGRRVLRLRGYRAPLWVGNTVQFESAPGKTFAPLPQFLRGLQSRAFLWGWVQLPHDFCWILDIPTLMRGSS